MLLAIRLKALLKTCVLFINNLPRKHFFALILLFVFLLIISFIPSQKLRKKTIERQLVLPPMSTTAENYAIAEPIAAVKEVYSEVFPDFSGNREVQIEIKTGDTLSEIFQQEGLSAALLQELLEEDKQYLRLSNLLPGQKVKLLINPENKLLVLKVVIDLANTLTFTLKDDQYISLLEIKKGEWRNSVFQGSVTGSFYLDAKQAGLSAGQIQQISGALQDKFDFNRQFRLGDTFHILVSKQYIDGEYSFDSEVLAILIKTRLKNYSAFLYEDGRYYDQNGLGLNKAYRRSPLIKRYRISSPFNLRRLHPITKRISPHNGTDFAAPTGTKVYSIGDGIVVRAGYHPAAGNYIVIKHGRKYTSRYLHLSKIYVHKGQRVTMDTLIAKTGNTGRSTGAHLHYELHVYDRPVDAMKARLPLSKEVPRKQIKTFMQRRDLFLKEMGETSI
ncbi:peptidoglycan DD-metalloendopeptidase family protein [Psychromonas antarctica]|uniref:peptidoglycan DD-metalloendopeptidase family protein n=1 Tax=Psychromonas antarctica TaxID=67573 RepID=UPI001EE8E919|nr:peptidoglycan DD-metalloendopeptidase family protein [Psychromonas antarctica]MCG6200181.1 peptidoglycan DD-metalloendopeptidase family protein [Psychromonas antarctica]